MKKLPIVNAPSMVCTLPIQKQEVTYRPFVIKEQKAMLLAQQSEDEATIGATVRDVILSCTNGTLDYDKAPTADIAYFFLQMQIASVGPERRVQIPCVSCSEPILLNIDLTKITVSSTDINKKIMITDTIGVLLRLPTMADARASMSSEQGIGRNQNLLSRLIESVFDEDSVYIFAEYTDAERHAWLDALSDEQLIKIQEFVDQIPELRHDLTYSCPHCHTKQRKLLEGLHGFFRPGDDQ